VEKLGSRSPVREAAAMKATIATVALITSCLCARLGAADATPAPLSVEQQFQQADIQAAVEHYKKLRLALLDLTLKLKTEARSPAEQEHLQKMRNTLQDLAEDLRADTLKAAGANVTVEPGSK
jgi:hypothetical protein